MSRALGVVTEIVGHFHRVALLLATAFTASRARFAQAFLVALLLAGTFPAQAQRYDRGLLWRVEGAGAQASHVFGTVHLSDPRVTKLPPEVARALDGARSFAMEVGIDPSNLLPLATRMVFMDGRDLPGAVGAELFQRAAALTGTLGLPEAAVRRFRPWALAMLLIVPPQKTEEVLDFVLASTARAQGKPVYELETLDEQIAVFEGLSDGNQAEFLRQAVDNYAQLPQMIERIVQAYLARDLAAMQRINEEKNKGGAETKQFDELFTRRLLDERNARMAERMQGQLKEGGAFVAVGALHLHGDRGVLAELARRGWRLTRVY